MYGLLMLDIEGTQLDDSDIELLQQPTVGGLILFGRNVDNPVQIRSLTDHIRQVNPSLIISVDQEGGRVARFREGFSSLPAAGKLGELFIKNSHKALQLAYHSGYLMAAEVLAVGVDISFAPVLDVDGISKVIRDRGFHQTPEAVISLATQFMKGMKSAGMTTTGKHFPGHGSVAPDSHVDQAIDDREFEQIFEYDMQTFIQTMPLLDGLMPAHVIFSKVDDKPAGFSQIWLQNIVREQLNFDGVLFSDDLSMKAAHAAGNVGDRVKQAIEAGCDMALVCNDRSSALEAIPASQAICFTEQDIIKRSLRVKKMKANIPMWLGSLEETCTQFPEWQVSKMIVADFMQN